MNDLSKRLMEMTNFRDGTTHYERCWMYHDDCALAIASELLEDRDRYKKALERIADGDGIDRARCKMIAEKAL